MGGGMSIEMWRAERDDVTLQARLQDGVFAEFAWETGLDAQDVAVDVTDRAVTLSGTVKSYPQRLAAERAAKRVRGVQEVRNDLAVALPNGQERSDRALTRAALRALDSDVLVPHGAVHATATNGVVRLEGVVSKDTERRAAEDVTACLVGVKQILNLIAVRAGPVAANVKARVESALDRAAELRGDRISVEVQDEAIALHGRVRSLAERDEARRAAWTAPGVTLVRDDLRIEG